MRNGTMEESSPSTQDAFSPPFEPPTYALSFAEDSTLKWDPPIGSPELALALSYHFPLQKTLAEKMQAAMGAWLKQQKKAMLASASEQPRAKTFADEIDVCPAVIPSIESSSKTPPSLAAHKRANRCARTIFKKDPVVSTSRNNIPGMTSWHLQVGGSTPGRRRKRAYTEKERKEVGRNRGKVCEFHKLKKLKCDPNTCPHNKLRVESKVSMTEDPSSNLLVERPGNDSTTGAGNDPFGQAFLAFESKSFDKHGSVPHSTDSSSSATNTTPNFLLQSPPPNRQESQPTNSQIGESSLNPHPHTEPSVHGGQSPETVNSSNSKDAVESTLSEPQNVWSPVDFSPSLDKREPLQFDQKNPNLYPQGIDTEMGISDNIKTVLMPLFGDQWLDHFPPMDNLETHLDHTDASMGDYPQNSEMWFDQSPGGFGCSFDPGDLTKPFSTVPSGDSFDLIAEPPVEGTQFLSADHFDHSSVAPPPLMARMSSPLSHDWNDLPLSPALSAPMARRALTSLAEMPLPDDEIHDFGEPVDISASSAKSVGSSAGAATTAKPKTPSPSRPVGSKIAAIQGGFMLDLNKRLQLGSQAPTKKEHENMDTAIEPDPVPGAGKLLSKNDQEYSQYSQKCSTMTVPQLQIERQNHIRQLPSAAAGCGLGLSSFTFGFSLVGQALSASRVHDTIWKLNIVEKCLSAQGATGAMRTRDTFGGIVTGATGALFKVPGSVGMNNVRETEQLMEIDKADLEPSSAQAQAAVIYSAVYHARSSRYSPFSSWLGSWRARSSAASKSSPKLDKKLNENLAAEVVEFPDIPGGENRNPDDRYDVTGKEYDAAEGWGSMRVPHEVAHEKTTNGIEEEEEGHDLKEDDLVPDLDVDPDGDDKADIKGSEKEARIEADEDLDVRGLFEGLFLE